MLNFEKNKIVLLIILFTLSGCAARDNIGFVKINNQVINVEIADDPQEKYQGLSGRESMGENEGMLFVFDEPGIYTFIMREMKFPLDIIWIKDKKIVDISRDLPAPEEGGRAVKISPVSAVNYVLEVNGGWAERHGARAGDAIEKQIIRNLTKTLPSGKICLSS